MCVYMCVYTEMGEKLFSVIFIQNVCLSASVGTQWDWTFSFKYLLEVFSHTFTFFWSS